MMSPAIQALFWGMISGGALLLGAAFGYRFNIPSRIVAAIMAFGSGVLISALCFELMDEAFAQGGLGPAAFGFAAGALIYTGANWLLGRAGAKHRKRSGDQQPSEEQDSGSGTAIAIGALLAGIPESMAIGLSILHGGAVSVATVAAIFLSNLPEGLSSSAGMRKAGRSRMFVFGLWTAIAVISGGASLLGYTLLGGLSDNVVAGTTALAAGAILAMIVDTMIPEAFAETHNGAGLVTTLGFLLSFSLTKLAG